MKTRERNGIAWISGIADKYNLNLSLKDAGPLYDDICEHFAPAVNRSSIEVMQDALDQLRTVLDQLDPTEPLTLRHAMTSVGLDPSIRSDAFKVRKFLMDSEVMLHNPRGHETWQRRLTGPGNGTTQATEPTGD